MPNCLILLKQLVCLAFSRALLRTGRSIAARIAMIAITINNSINVKPRLPLQYFMALPPCNLFDDWIGG